MQGSKQAGKPPQALTLATSIGYMLLGHVSLLPYCLHTSMFPLTPCSPAMQRVLYFDVGTMYLGLGPLRIPIPLKKDCKPLEARDPK